MKKVLQPYKPIGLAPQVVDSQTVRLYWLANRELDIAYYEIYRDTVSTPEKLVGTSKDTFYTDTGLTINKDYYYRIRAVNAQGMKSGFSDEKRIRIMTYTAKKTKMICKDNICRFEEVEETVINKPPSIDSCYVTPLWINYRQAPILWYVKVSDPDGLKDVVSVKNLVIKGKTRPGQITDDGLGGDKKAGDGIYSGYSYLWQRYQPGKEKHLITVTDSAGNTVQTMVEYEIIKPVTGLLDYKPKKPQVGDTLVIRYDPNRKGCTLKDAKEVYLVWATSSDNWTKTKMKRIKGKWTASIPIDEATKAICWAFTDGNWKVDNNLSKLWTVLVYDEEGKPVRGAHLQNGKCFAGGAVWEASFGYARGGYSLPIDYELKEAEFRKELELYPDNYDTYYQIWYTHYMEGKCSDSAKAAVESEMDELANKMGAKPNFLVALAKAYRYIMRDQKKALKIYKEIVDSFPSSEAAIEATIGLAWQEKDIGKAIQMCEHVLERDPNNIEAMQFLLHRYRYESDYKNIDRAKELSERLHGLDPSNPVHWENLAQIYAEEEIDLDQAVLFGKKADSLAMNPKLPDASLFWGPEGPRVILQYPKYSYGLALAYFKKKMYEEAEKELLGLIEESEGRDIRALALLADCYSRIGKEDDAISVYLKVLGVDRSHKEAHKMLERLYIKKYGSKEGYDQFVHDKLVEMGKIRGAPDFTLEDLDGNKVSLSDYKGKIVILDFWATWCHPCVEELPHIQKLHEKFKEEEIVVLTINMDWEKEKVRSFMEKHEYTFKVLLCTDEVRKAYGVTGIPSVFVIDKQGMIQANYVGYGEDIEQKIISDIKKYQ